MADDTEIRTRFWKALKNDRTMFLGLAEGEDGNARPMTAQLDDEMFDGDDYNGPVWFFTSTDNTLYQLLEQAGQASHAARANRAMAHFTSKGHDIWATLHGSLSTSRDRAIIDHLWNRFVAAWYESKDDPKIALIRLDPEEAQIWIDASSMVAGIKMLLGIDPKKDYRDKVATVDL